MAYLLRKIDKQSSWWPENPGELASWLQPTGTLQADAISELRTSQNTLSVWFISDDKSNLEPVICAIAAGRDTISPVDYVLLDLLIIEQHGFRIEATPGKSPYQACNKQWHRDIIQLSAPRLLDLAKLIYDVKSADRVLPKKVKELINQAFSTGSFDTTKMKPQLLKKLTSSAKTDLTD